MTNWRQIFSWQQMNSEEQILGKFREEVYSKVKEVKPDLADDDIADWINTIIGQPAFMDASDVTEHIILSVYEGWNTLVKNTVDSILSSYGLMERYRRDQE